MNDDEFEDYQNAHELLASWQSTPVTGLILNSYRRSLAGPTTLHCFWPTPSPTQRSARCVEKCRVPPLCPTPRMQATDLRRQRTSTR